MFFFDGFGGPLQHFSQEIVFQILTKWRQMPFVLILIQNYHVVFFVYELRRLDYRRLSRFAID